jgi:hypothetical protein
MTTTTAGARFPDAFAHLEPFGNWILPTERDRIEARLTTPYETSHAFYTAMLAEVPAIMAYLRSQPVDTGDEQVLALLHLTLAFTEIANAVEIYGESEVPDGANLRLFVSVLEGSRG